MAKPHCHSQKASRRTRLLTSSALASILLAFAGNAFALTNGPVRLIPLSDPQKQLAIYDNALTLGELRKGNETDLVINEFKDEKGKVFYYIAQRSDPTALLNIQTGQLKFSVVPKEWWSAQWVVQDKDGIIKLVSRWKPGMAIGLTEAGGLEAVPETSEFTNWKTISLERDSRDSVDFSKVGLLAKPGSTLASNTGLQLVQANTLSENTALLARRLEDDVYRFISFDGDIVLSLNVEKGQLGLSQIAPDWWSGHWVSQPNPTSDNTLVLVNRWKPDLILARDDEGKLHAAKKNEANLADARFQWNIATATGEILNKPKPKPELLSEKKLFTRQMLEVVDEQLVTEELGTSPETVSSYPAIDEPPPVTPVFPGSSLTTAPQSPANTVASYYAYLQLQSQNASDESDILDASQITFQQAMPEPREADARPVKLEASPVMKAVNDGPAMQTAALEPAADTISGQSGDPLNSAANRLEENYKELQNDELAEQDRITQALTDSSVEESSGEETARDGEIQLASAQNNPAKKDTVEPVIIKPGSREAEAEKLPSEETIRAAEKRIAKHTDPHQAGAPEDGQAKPDKPEEKAAEPAQEDGKVPQSKLANLLKRIHGEVVTGNSNSKEVGPWQAYTKLYANDLLGKGETIWLIGDSFAWGDELKAIRGGIDLPLNKARDWHLRYNFHISHINPTPVEDDFKWLDIHEREQNVELFKVTEKTGHRNETGLFFNHLDSGQQKQELDDNAPRDLSFASSDVGLFTAGYFWKENEETKLAGNYYMSLSKGIDMFGASNYFKVRTEAEPFPLVWKGRFNIRHDWKKSGWHVAGSVGAHYADRVSEWHKHFALGGQNYASGYSSAEAAGEIGAGAWAEIGKAFPASLELAGKKLDFKMTPYVRADIGHVHSRYTDPIDPLDYMRTTTLTSAVAGVRLEHEKWSFDLGYAVPISGKSRFENGKDGRFVFSSSLRW